MIDVVCVLASPPQQHVPFGDGWRTCCTMTTRAHHAIKLAIF